MIRSSRRITSPVAWTVKRKNPRDDSPEKTHSYTQYHFCPQKFELLESFLPTDSCHQNHFCPHIRESRTISANRFVPLEPFYHKLPCGDKPTMVHNMCWKFSRYSSIYNDIVLSFYLFCFTVLFKKEKNVSTFQDYFFGMCTVYLVQVTILKVYVILVGYLTFLQVVIRN